MVFHFPGSLLRVTQREPSLDSTCVLGQATLHNAVFCTSERETLAAVACEPAADLASITFLAVPRIIVAHVASFTVFTA